MISRRRRKNEKDFALARLENPAWASCTVGTWVGNWKDAAQGRGGRVMGTIGGIMKTLYDFDSAFENLMDDALNNLSPESFQKFKDDITMILTDYED